MAIHWSNQFYCQDKLMDRGAWCATVHGVTKTWTQLNNWALTHAILVKLSNLSLHPWYLSVKWGNTSSYLKYGKITYAKLIYTVRSQSGDFSMRRSVTGKGHREASVMLVIFFIWMLVTWMCSVCENSSCCIWYLHNSAFVLFFNKVF